MDWLIVLPVVDPVAGAECILSMTEVDRERLIVVNNTRVAASIWIPFGVGHVIDARTNLGVARSWNIGAQRVIDERRDLLVLMSSSMRFGDPGGADLVGQLDQANEWGIETIGHGWHLIGFTRATFERVGLFDDGFWPAYFEDTDYLYRMGLADVNSPRENGRSQPYIAVDATAETAATIRGGHVNVDMGSLERRYVAKWGGPQGSERFRTPWNL